VKTLNVKKIAELLDKKVETVRNDLKRRPHCIPPKLNIPGKLLWLEADVVDWFEKRRQKPKGRPREHDRMAAI
jgi:hypothetical protein